MYDYIIFWLSKALSSLLLLGLGLSIILIGLISYTIYKYYVFNYSLRAKIMYDRVVNNVMRAGNNGITYQRLAVETIRLNSHRIFDDVTEFSPVTDVTQFVYSCKKARQRRDIVFDNGFLVHKSCLTEFKV